ncbi:Sec-independent protein translocase subunit TatA [Kitasatospora sp. NPDC093550]|uniref:Sec-independent protein translocase subunit TatA n=1 Tax=Kitasatospora sp. NPDC093550 TaxID=3364089 RepID=UPI00381A6AF0
MRISMTAIVVIVVLAIVLFGAKRLPDVARSLGQSLRILKSEAKAMRTDGESEPSARAGGATVDGSTGTNGSAGSAGSTGSEGKTIQAAPGASATARPVAEPDGERSH